MCQICKIMIHRGEIVEKAVRSSGTSITNLAKRLGKSRRHIYNLFNNSNVSWEMILEIGKIIHYDFGPDFSEFSKIKEYSTGGSEAQIISDSSENYNSTDWKNKYFELLEKYNELMTKYIKLIE